MCDHSAARSQSFQVFCDALGQGLVLTPLLDVGLVAMTDLLARRRSGPGQWFECEVRHILRTADDTHAVLGARVLLDLWASTQRRSERA
jgi:hypothetical protein